MFIAFFSSNLWSKIFSPRDLAKHFSPRKHFWKIFSLETRSKYFSAQNHVKGSWLMHSSPQYHVWSIFTLKSYSKHSHLKILFKAFLTLKSCSLEVFFSSKSWSKYFSPKNHVRSIFYVWFFMIECNKGKFKQNQ